MIWLTWRQSRLESLIGGAALVVVAVFLLVSGQEIVSAYRDSILPDCAAQRAEDQSCREAASYFLQEFSDIRGIKMVFLICLPFLVGLLLAAPMVLDFEHGTYRLAWTQSVTRRRWLATKLAYGLALSAVVSVPLIALWMWGRGPIDDVQGRFNSNSFDFEGTVPIAYTVFAFALCLAAGTLLRRAIPAVGIGLVGFLVVRAFVSDQLRHRYLSPLDLSWDPIDPIPAAARNQAFNGDWILGDGYLDAQGNRITGGDEAVRGCMINASAKIGDDRVSACLHDHGIRYALLYHPADRFWTFQAIETGLFLGLSALLLAVTALWVMRRIV
jgi:hypothetical protein